MAFLNPPGASDPRSRLVALVTALAVVLVSMYSCHSYTTPGTQLAQADKTPMRVADERATVEDPLSGVRPREELQEHHILDFVSSDDVNRMKAHDLSQIRVALDEGFGWLKTRTHEDLRQRAWPRGRWSHAKIMQEPDRWRMQIMHVYGMLLYHEVVELGDMPVGMGKLHKLILFDIRNHIAFTVLTPLMPRDARALGEPKGGTYLACDGMFIMRYPYLSNDGWKPTPLFLAKRAYFSTEPLNVRPYLDPRGDPGETYTEIRPKKTVPNLDVRFLEEQMVSPPKDGSGFRRPGVIDYHLSASAIGEEKPAYDHAFEYLFGQDVSTFPERVNPEVTYVKMMKGNAAPKWMVGEFTRFEGLASFVKTYKFPSAENGITRIHLLISHDSRLRGPNFTWALASLNLPEGLRESDEIEVEGIFLKLFPYRNKEGNWHWAPLIACRSIRIIRDDTAEGFSLTYILVGISVLVLVGGVYWASQRDTADLSAMRHRVLARRIEREKKAPPAPSGDKATTEPSPASDQDSSDPANENG